MVKLINLEISEISSDCLNILIYIFYNPSFRSIFSLLFRVKSYDKNPPINQFRFIR